MYVKTFLDTLKPPNRESVQARRKSLNPTSQVEDECKIEPTTPKTKGHVFPTWDIVNWVSMVKRKRKFQVIKSS